MAWKLQLSDLARATLRVLVVERALEPAHSRIISNVTKFGRPRTSLSDDISTVVEHATESIRIRCQEASDNIFSENPYDWLQLPSWGLFMQIGTVLAADIAATGDMQLTDKITEEICEHHKRVNGRLLHYITSAISRAFDAVKAGTVIGANRLGEMDNDRLAYANGDVGFQSTKQIMTSMSKEQILLMPLFWNRLRIEVAEYEAFRDCCNAGREMIMLTTLLNKAVGEGMFSSLRAEHPMSVPLGPISFHDELCREIDKLSRDWVPFYGNLEVPLHRTTHLALGFAEDEFKFLPLWAGGLDDETGAVFDDMDVPDTDMGPNQPGPAYITGKTIAPSSTADSDITIIGGGMSVQAVQSGANTNASVSKTTGSFVKVSPSETSNLENLDLMHSDTKSMRSAMGGIGIFSDSSTRSLRNAMDDIGMASESDEVGDIESSHNIDDDDDDDAQSLAANPDDITADSDSMSDDSDWTDIYN
ncbi:hypothetical protein BKA67DRAFT_552297 [Truncatella angustata]|uniref:Uncharacterized protein n=1 Tax=Truncatella angustata TaxID=152316 RepID=A0A9P8UQE5_9PEZI|nr:uncharacterized protein BKA67DRAFT_552297 [Truncatella angustata]KAH6656547.1 hypothetical protein BKA67DRAFT_552297 [Truncatella angustata]